MSAMHADVMTTSTEMMYAQHVTLTEVPHNSSSTAAAQQQHSSSSSSSAAAQQQQQQQQQQKQQRRRWWRWRRRRRRRRQHGRPVFARLSQQHRGPPEREERPYKNMVDTSSPRLMSRSILVHRFWPPLMLDLLQLLCRLRRRYYCCCCCFCCAVSRPCVRSKKHKRETVCCDGLCSAMHRKS